MRVLEIGLVLLLLAATSEAEVPDLIEGDDPGTPTWISVERAAPEGRVDWSYFSSTARQQLERMITLAHAAEADRPPSEAAESGGCATESLSPHAHFGQVRPSQSPDEYARNALLIVEGSVRDESAGFYRGALGTAYEVEVTEILKLEGSQHRPDTVFIFWRSGRASIGDTVICTLGPRGSERPRVASRVLIVIEDPSHLGPEFYPLYDQELFFERVDGTTSSPGTYPNEVDLQYFADQVASGLGSAGP